MKNQRSQINREILQIKAHSVTSKICAIVYYWIIGEFDILEI